MGIVRWEVVLTAPRDRDVIAIKDASCSWLRRQLRNGIRRHRIPVAIGAGVSRTSFLRRSEIFARVGKRQRYKIAIAFQQDQTFTLVHVEEPAEEIVRLVKAKPQQIEALSGNLELGFADTVVSGSLPG